MIYSELSWKDVRIGCLSSFLCLGDSAISLVLTKQHNTMFQVSYSLDKCYVYISLKSISHYSHI